MLSAKDVAGWFVIHAHHMTNGESDVSNMKLQKLLYYAQGHSLGSTGKPLFTEGFEAWEHGPVVREVYAQYAGRSSAVIEPTGQEEAGYQRVCADRDTLQLLERVWGYYGHKAAWALRNATHDEQPWLANYVKGQKVSIPSADMKAFFEDEYFSSKFDNYLDKDLADQLADWLS